MDSVNSISSNFCLICYRPNSAVVSIQASEKFILFVTLLRRFVNDNQYSSKVDYLKSLTDTQSCNLGCCKECLNQTESFCDVYQQYKCLQLQLQWKINKLSDIIKLANKVPSRISQVKISLQISSGKGESTDEFRYGNEKLKQVQNFRHHLTKICRRKLARSLPRVLLHKEGQLLQDLSEQNILIPTESSVCNDNDEAKYVTFNSDTQILPKPQNEENPVHKTNGQISAQNQNDTAIPNPQLLNTIGNEDSTLGTNPSNLFDEEPFEDFNTFPICDDPLDDIDQQNVAGNEPFYYSCIGNTSTNNSMNSNHKYSSVVTVAENVCDIQNDNVEIAFPHSSNTTVHLSSQDKQIKLENGFVTYSHSTYSSKSRNTSDDDDHNDNVIQETNPLPIDQKDDKQKRYSLRQKQVIHYGQTLQDKYPGTRNKSNDDLEYKNTSESSSSSSTDEEPEKKKPIPKLKLVRKKRALGRFQHGYIPCKVSGCAEVYYRKTAYLIHFKLHKPGKYPCNFCKHEETDVIKLGKHEYRKHSHIKSEPNAKQDRRKNPWSCPRCLYQSSCTLDYDTHFAFTHFGIGDNPESTSLLVDPRIRQRGNYKLSSGKVKLAECEICKRKLRADKIKYHFTNFHDLSKIDVKDIWKCDDDKCSAYFLKKNQLYLHYTSEHNIERGKRTIKISNKEKRKVPKIMLINCEICNQKVHPKYKQNHYKTWHYTTQTNEMKRCQMENCQAYFLTDEQLKKHAESQHEKVLRCARCKQKFPTRILLYRHRWQKQTNCKFRPSLKSMEVTSTKFQCKFCEFTTAIPKVLANHEADSHVSSLQSLDSTNEEPKENFRCSRCPFQYKLKIRYVEHFITVHLNILSANCPDACKLCSSDKIYVENSESHFNTFHNTEILDDPNKIFKCDFQDCPAYFLKWYQLHCHKTRIHPILKCLKCVKTFKKRRNLLDHLRKCRKPYSDEDHPNLNVSCDNTNCTSMFQTEEEMQVHKMYAHPKNPKKTKEKDEVCSKCGKKYKSIGGLKLHLKMGHTERSLVCSECGKVFKFKHLLEQHMKFHKGPDAWEYQCPECGKKCFDKQKLEEHMRTHTKEKPFVCQFCGGKYAHRHNWRNHLKTKHGDEKGIDEIVGKGKKGNYMSRKGSTKGLCIMSSSQST